jgi:S-adenosylmethionine decarboxylase
MRTTHPVRLRRPAETVTPARKRIAEPFGTHLTLDGYGCGPDALNSMETVFASLRDLPDLLNMHRITTPYVVQCAGNDKKDPGGFSGFVMIAESHISVHTFPAKGFVSIDVYTCQGSLNVPFVKAYFASLFGISEFETHVVRRGRRYASL